MRTVTYWLSLIMIFLIPWEGIATLPGFGSASRIVGLLVAASWLFLVVTRGGVRKISPFHIFVFLFFLWNAMSVLWSLYPNYSMKRIETYVRMAGMVLIIWDLYDTQDAIKAGLQAFVLGAYAPVTSIIYNFINGSMYGFYRFSAAGRDTNTTGFILAFAIPIAVYLATTPSTSKSAKVLKLANFAYIPAAAFAVTLTGTRFAMIMSIPTLLYILLALTRLSLFWRILVLVMLSVALLYLPSMIPEGTIARLSTADDEIIGGDLNGRIGFWKNGLDLWSKQPILGIGSGAFPRAVVPIYGRIRSMHNSYVSVLVETGIIGFVLFGTILATVVHQIRLLPKLEARFWVTILIVWGIGNLVMTWEHTNSTWLLFSLIVGAAYVSRQNGASLSPAEPMHRDISKMPHSPSLST